MIRFTIQVAPVTKKNHGRIIRNNGRTFMIPSEAYVQYEKDAKWFMPHIEPIDYPVNVKAVFYTKTKRRIDLVNLEQALLDVLVKYGVLADDNSEIVYSMDGSYVDYDKERPRTEVEIWEIEK